MVAIEQGGIVETAISCINEMIDSTINYSVFSIAKWSP